MARKKILLLKKAAWKKTPELMQKGKTAWKMKTGMKMKKMTRTKIGTRIAKKNSPGESCIF